jgi:hypothetical protein
MCYQENTVTVTVAELAMTSFSDATTNRNNYICDASPTEAKVSSDNVTVAVTFFTTLCKCK